MAERTVSVRLAAKVDSYVAGMRAAAASTTGFSRATERNLTRVGSQMQNVGRQMTTFVSLPIVAAGALAVKAAVDWESAWAGVTKTVDGTASQMAELEQGLRDMTKEVSASHGEIAAVAEAAGALGVETDSILEFTRVMIDLGETTDLTSDQAATAIAKMMNVMQSAPDDVDNLGAALVHLGNNGASTESQILDMAGRIAAAGAIVGLSEADVLGFANALASMGIEAEAGGSAFSRVISDMSKAVSQGGDDLNTFASVAGMSASQFATAFREDPSSAIVSFIDGLARIHAASGDVFTVLDNLGLSDIRVSRALLSMATSGDVLHESLVQGEEAWASNTALAEEAAKRYDTAGARFEMVRNKLVDLFIDLGEIILPVVETVVDVIGVLAEKFQALPQPLQIAVGGFLGVVAAMGPMVFIAGSLIKNLTNITSAMSKIGPAASKAGLALGAIGIALTVGFLAHEAFTAKQDELRQRTGEVAAAMIIAQGTVFNYALGADGAESSVVGLAAAQAALSEALTQSGDDGAKLTDSLGALGRQTSEAAEILLDFGDTNTSATAALYRLAVGAGVAHDKAEILAKMVAESEDAETLALVVTGALGEEYVGLALAMEEVQDQAEKTDLDKVATQALNAAAASSEHADQLIRQAKAQLEAEGAATDAVSVYMRFAELLATADQATQDAILSSEGYQSALADLPPELQDIIDGSEGAAGAMGEMESVAASSIDTMSHYAENLALAAQMTGIYSDALGTALGDAGQWIRAHDGFASALLGFNETVDESSDGLDFNTEAGLKNRGAVMDLADELVALTESNIQAGMSQADTAVEYHKGREALLDAAEAAGLNRDEVEALITTYGLTPELIVTTMNIAGDALDQWRIDRYLAKLDEVPEDVATEIEALIDMGMYDEALALLNSIPDPEVTVRIRVPVTPVRWSSDGRNFQVGSVRGSVDAAGAFVPGGSNRWGTTGEIPGSRGDEVILPLGDPGRMAALLGMSQVGPRVAAAFGNLMPAGGFGGGTSSTSNVTHETHLHIYNYGRDLTAGDLDQAIVRTRMAA